MITTMIMTTIIKKTDNENSDDNDKTIFKSNGN